LCLVEMHAFLGGLWRGLRTRWCAYERIIIEVNSIANLMGKSNGQDHISIDDEVDCWPLGPFSEHKIEKARSPQR